MNIFEFVVRPFHCLHVLYGRMKEDRVFETASALTYQTALALVPLLAVLLAIAKGFSLDEYLEAVLFQEFGDHREILQHLLTFSKTTLEQIKGGVIAGVGVLFLLITTTNLLSTTEDAMNRMWGMTSGRSLARRIADFQSCLFLFPFLLVISSSTTLFLQTTVRVWVEGRGFVEPFFVRLGWILPFLSLWVLFSLSYWLIPYVPVKKRYAFLTAAGMTCAFHLLQTWYIYLQVTLTKISVIYGSFAALPLFLVWLYLSWLFFLIGSELLVFLHERGWGRALLKWDDSEGALLSATLALFHEVVRAFQRGEVYSVSKWTKTIQVPMRVRARLIRALYEKKLIYVFAEGRANHFLVPSRKGLKGGVGDLLLPSTESVSEEVEKRMEHWKSLLNASERKEFSIKSHNARPTP